MNNKTLFYLAWIVGWLLLAMGLTFAGQENILIWIVIGSCIHGIYTAIENTFDGG